MRKTVLLYHSRWGLSPAPAPVGAPALEAAPGASPTTMLEPVDMPESCLPIDDNLPSTCAVPAAEFEQATAFVEAAALDDRGDAPAPPPPRPSSKRRRAKAALAVPCPCHLCLHRPGHPEEGYHRDLRSLLGRLGEPQRRWVAALEARRLGFGGTRIVARITGLDEKTVRRGRRELDTAFADVPTRRLRRPSTKRRAGGEGGLSSAQA